MGVPILRAVLSLGLTLLVLSVMALLFVSTDSPSFVPAVLATLANLITVLVAAVVLRRLSGHGRG
jgi:uncharacterized membrane protein